MKKLYVLIFSAVLLSGCNSYLDTMPDNRTEIDTEEKVMKLIGSAYITGPALLVTEFMSDNVDNYGENNPNTSRFADQVYSWSDVTEGDNESPETFWESAYTAIATANQALLSIEEMGGATTSNLREAKAEALLCRAYAHFMLVNMFCRHYNKQTSQTDFGIPYMTRPETTIGVYYERGTVAGVYDQIDRDLQEALPMVGDAHFNAVSAVPKYHFNQRAAYAFACRFYLYYEQWDKAVEYANRCLGNSPAAMLRDWKATSEMVQEVDAITLHYIDATLNCNLLMMTAYSYMGLVFGPYMVYARYAHGAYLANNEDGEAENIWGRAEFYSPMSTYAATNLDKVIFWKLPYLFEYTDAVKGVGYIHTVYPAFTADECLLNRAEAYIMLRQYDKAAADLTMWMQNIIKTNMVLTPQNIQAFYGNPELEYCYSDEKGIGSTIKKHLHPAFAIDAEGSVQETMLQCVLGFRRIETLQTGLRWYDIKRYGIEIVRRLMNEAGRPERRTDYLKVDDPRRAVQIPKKVLDAEIDGKKMAPNPR